MMKPTTIALMERRRSPRRRFRLPAELMLQEAAEDSRWWCRAALFNLSVDGIACRVAESVAGPSGPVEIGRTLRVIFRLAGASASFELDARVVTITEGGTPDSLVLGLEFVADRRLEISRPRLRDALISDGVMNDQ